MSKKKILNCWPNTCTNIVKYDKSLLFSKDIKNHNLWIHQKSSEISFEILFFSIFLVFFGLFALKDFVRDYSLLSSNSF